MTDTLAVIAGIRTRLHELEDEARRIRHHDPSATASIRSYVSELAREIDSDLDLLLPEAAIASSESVAPEAKRAAELWDSVRHFWLTASWAGVRGDEQAAIDQFCNAMDDLDLSTERRTLTTGRRAPSGGTDGR